RTCSITARSRAAASSPPTWVTSRASWKAYGCEEPSSGRTRDPPRWGEVVTRPTGVRAAFDAAGSVTVITGGSSGIGWAAAAALAAAGGTVHILDVNQPAHDLSAGRQYH